MIYSENPFYSDYDDDQRFPHGWAWQQVGQRMIKVGKETVDAHPLTAEAVLKCRRRAHGCAACIAYYEQSGEYAAQEADATAHKQEGRPLPAHDRLYIEPEPDDHFQAFAQKFHLPH